MREGNVLQKPLARKLPPKLLESSVSIKTASSLDDFSNHQSHYHLHNPNFLTMTTLLNFLHAEIAILSVMIFLNRVALRVKVRRIRSACHSRIKGKSHQEYNVENALSSIRF